MQTITVRQNWGERTRPARLVLAALVLLARCFHLFPDVRIIFALGIGVLLILAKPFRNVFWDLRQQLLLTPERLIQKRGKVERSCARNLVTEVTCTKPDSVFTGAAYQKMIIAGDQKTISINGIWAMGRAKLIGLFMAYCSQSGSPLPPKVTGNYTQPKWAQKTIWLMVMALVCVILFPVIFTAAAMFVGGGQRHR